MEVSSLLHSPETLPPIPIGEEAGWAPEPECAPTGNRTLVVKPAG